MKRLFALMLTAVMLAAVFAIPAFADVQIDLLMSTPGVCVERAKQGAKPEELADAIEAGAELIPEECRLDPERITVLQTGALTCGEEGGYATFKVWSTVNRTIGLFFQAADSAEWELISCSLGDVIEGEFQSAGTYAIVVGW
ncbi:MAG: hypothetical protein ACI3XG_03870 [Faecousia sp.]